MTPLEVQKGFVSTGAKGVIDGVCTKERIFEGKFGRRFAAGLLDEVLSSSHDYNTAVPPPH